jgi:hypothetical protein
MTQKTISVIPNSGTLKAYEKLPLVFKCDVPVSEAHQQGVKV